MLIGVEEEYLVVDPVTRCAVPSAAQIVAACATPQVGTEITRFQIEARTSPHLDAAALGRELIGLRRLVASAAAEAGLRVVASGTPVLGSVVPPPITDDPRYGVGIANYRALHDEQAVCASQVHVDMPDREQAMLVSNHLRPWLPVLIALMANSPFWAGRDTGYASWRTLTWNKWPVAGPPPYFSSYGEYEALVATLTETGVLVDPGTVFWDLRPSARLPTLEMRVADMPVTAAQSVRYAELYRSMVTAALRRVAAGDPGLQLSPELLRAAYWQAARDGLEGSSIDPVKGVLVPASSRVEALFSYAGLDMPEWPSGAARQRAAHASGGLTGVVDYLVSEFLSEEGL